MIYFIQMGSNGPIKIGQANKPNRRLAELQTASPYKLYLLTTTRDYQEKRLHGRFAHLRLEGEWFTPESDLLDFITSLHKPSRVTGDPGDCGLCGLSFVPDSPEDIKLHNKQHMAVARGVMPHHIREFVKSCGWAIAHNDGGVKHLASRTNKEQAMLAVAFSWWHRALVRGVPVIEFDDFMTDHLVFIDAMVEGKQETVMQTHKSILKWERYAG